MTEDQSWVIKLPYPRPPLSLNRQMHHMKLAKIKREIKDDIGWLARHHKLPKDLQQVRVTLLWVVRDNRRRDTDNPMLSVKPMIDALVTHGLVPDDCAAHVHSQVEIQEPPASGAHGVYLVIQDAPRGWDDVPPVAAVLR